MRIYTILSSYFTNSISPPSLIKKGLSFSITSFIFSYSFIVSPIVIIKEDSRKVKAFFIQKVMI